MNTAPPGTPAYICFASFSDRVIAYGHEESRDAAHAWCTRARVLLVDYADQVVIAAPQEVDWVGAGRSLTLAFVAGWMRVGHSWVTAESTLVRLHFDEICAGPTAMEQLRSPSGPPPSRLSSADREMRSLARILMHLGRGIQSLAVAARVITGARKKVLIVDDDPVAREVLEQELANDHDIARADGFPSALLELAHWDFDAVISDQSMGAVGTGLELLAEVRERWPRTRRVLCTANAAETELAMAMGVAHRVVKKPFDRSALRASLLTELSK